MLDFSVLREHQAGCLYVQGCFYIYFKALKPPGRGRSGRLTSCHLLSTSEPALFNGINFSPALCIQIHLLLRFCDSSQSCDSTRLLNCMISWWKGKENKAKQAKERNAWIFRILYESSEFLVELIHLSLPDIACQSFDSLFIYLAILWVTLAIP